VARSARDAVKVVSDALAHVPADALPVVTTTWALSHLPLESRLRFLHRLDEAAAGRAVAWVSVEGVGVAPTIPTLGDRRASGHSITGLAVFERSGCDVAVQETPTAPGSQTLVRRVWALCSSARRSASWLGRNPESAGQS
jgi:hypothetical protein